MLRGAVLFVLLASSVWAAEVTWHYRGLYVRNYDGDTITLQIMIWPDLVLTSNVRLRGVDTAEIQGKCEREKERARAARDYVAQLLEESPKVLVTVYAFDKYGRPVADITIEGGKDLSRLLLEQGHARPYSGGQRLTWCGDPS